MRSTSGDTTSTDRKWTLHERHLPEAPTDHAEAQRQAQRLRRMQKVELTITHIPGNGNVVAHTLWRMYEEQPNVSPLRED